MSDLDDWDYLDLDIKKEEMLARGEGDAGERNEDGDSSVPRSASVVTTPKDDNELAEEIIANMKLKEVSDAYIKNAQDYIDTLLPQESGNYATRLGDYMVTVKKSERWDWDNDKLNDIIEDLISVSGGYDINELIDMGITSEIKVSVNRKKFDSMPKDIQDRLLDALTRTPMKAKLCTIHKHTI